MNDTEFAKAVELCTFPLEEFSHANHVRLAWYYLKDSELPEAIIAFRDTLKKFAAHHGKSQLYHETITVAYMLLVHEAIRRRAGVATWIAFAELHPTLVTGGKKLLSRFYKPETLASSEAKRYFRLPDLAPLGILE